MELVQQGCDKHTLKLDEPSPAPQSVNDTFEQGKIPHAAEAAGATGAAAVGYSGARQTFTTAGVKAEGHNTALTEWGQVSLWQHGC